MTLDLERIRGNLSNATVRVATDEDVYRLLTQRGVWRHSDQWWVGSEAALARFAIGEVLERKMNGSGGLGGVPAPAR